MVIFGIIFILIPALNSYLKIPQNWLHFIESIGVTLLAGGIFSSFLRVLHFLKFFQEELLDIMYDDKYLKGRKDINLLWKSVSRHLYNQKFPKIADEIEDIVTGQYFPTNHQYYYHDYQLSAKMTIVDAEKQMIKLEEVVTLNIVANDKKEPIQFDFYRNIPKIGPDDLTTSFTVDSLKIDGEIVIPNLIHQNSTDEEIDVEYNTPEFKGKNEYKIELKTTKVYSIISNPIKSFTCQFLTQQMELHIEYPDSVEMTFFEAGTINEFTIKHPLSKNILCRHYAGVLLPRQGFIIVLRFK
jgi:hypothetical protein